MLKLKKNCEKCIVKIRILGENTCAEVKTQRKFGKFALFSHTNIKIKSLLIEDFYKNKHLHTNMFSCIITPKNMTMFQNFGFPTINFERPE